MFRTVKYGEPGPENQAGLDVDPRRRLEEVEHPVDEEPDGAEDPVGDALGDLVEREAGGAAEQSAHAVDDDADRVRDVGGCRTGDEQLARENAEDRGGRERRPIRPDEPAGVTRGPEVGEPVEGIGELRAGGRGVGVVEDRGRAWRDRLAPDPPVAPLPHQVDDRGRPARLRRGHAVSGQDTDVPDRDPRSVLVVRLDPPGDRALAVDDGPGPDAGPRAHPRAVSGVGGRARRPTPRRYSSADRLLRRRADPSRAGPGRCTRTTPRRRRRPSSVRAKPTGTPSRRTDVRPGPPWRRRRDGVTRGRSDCALRGRRPTEE